MAALDPCDLQSVAVVVDSQSGQIRVRDHDERSDGNYAVKHYLICRAKGVRWFCSRPFALDCESPHVALGADSGSVAQGRERTAPRPAQQGRVQILETGLVGDFSRAKSINASELEGVNACLGARKLL